MASSYSFMATIPLFVTALINLQFNSPKDSWSPFKLAPSQFGAEVGKVIVVVEQLNLVSK